MAIITVITDPKTVAKALDPQAHPIIDFCFLPKYSIPVGKNIPIKKPGIKIRMNVINILHIRAKWMNEDMILNKNREYKVNIKNNSTEKIRMKFFPTILLIFLDKSDPIPEETNREEIMAEIE
jgi:hypothetical protein